MRKVIFSYVGTVSHPTRVRGLKGEAVSRFMGAGSVAPHAGAWIESSSPPPACQETQVAPHAGAWIESFSPLLLVNGRSTSHPTRVRGLKDDLCSAPAHVHAVAPHAGAWIERDHAAPPSGTACWSHPTRVRGLKAPPDDGCPASNRKVAPHAGAWIERNIQCQRMFLHWVAPHAGAWIESPA